MSKAEKILSDKESYNFLRETKRVRVKIAMQEHTKQFVRELKDKLEQERFVLTDLGQVIQPEFSKGFDRDLEIGIELIDESLKK